MGSYAARLIPVERRALYILSAKILTVWKELTLSAEQSCS